MTRMQRSFTVQWEWWRADDGDEIPKEHELTLDVEARRAIAAGLQDAMTGGVLGIRVDTLGGEEFVYEGTWGITSTGGKNLPEDPDGT